MPSIGTIIATQRPLYHIMADTPVIEAVKAMVDHNVGALPVLDGDRLVGIFSERDLMRRVIVRGVDTARVKVGEVMATELVTADINDDHTTCLRKMSQYQCRHLPVIDGDKLVAFLSARDLMKAEVEGKELEIKSLTDYIHYVPPPSKKEQKN
jgi:CBS domain-containing protein